MVNTSMIVCSALESEVIAAQKKAKTEYEMVLIDSGLHIQPQRLKAEIENVLEELKGKNIELVLLAMGLCGNCLHELKSPIKLVIPRVDDCITMLLHTDGESFLNLKIPGHFYMTKGMVGLLCESSLELGMSYDQMVKKYGKQKSKMIMKMIYRGYKSFDMIDTGVYPLSDIYDKSKEKADLVDCLLKTVVGSNIVLENLVKGNWDRQFLVFEANKTITMFDFVPNNQNHSAKKIDPATR